MKGTTDFSNVREQGAIAPQDIYMVDIAEKRDKTSKNGDPMISIKLVIAEGPYIGDWVWDNILIPKPDSPSAAILGRTKHFLHCIGEPYEEDIVQWDSDRWVGKTCKIRLDHEPPNEYHKRVKPVVSEYILEDEDIDPTQSNNEETPF